MCYDISFQVHIKELSDYFPDMVYDNQAVLDFQPFDHVQGPSLFAPHPIIYINREDWKVHCKLMEWGIIEYQEEVEPLASDRNFRLNMRSEKVFNGTTYWYKIRNRRCLIPVTSVYEHRHIKGWKVKVPYNIKPAGSNVFFLPGLYSAADQVDRNGNYIKRFTFGMLTRKANSVMQQIHNAKQDDPRMPLFMHFDMAMEYLQEGLTVPRYKELLAYEMPSEELSYHPTFTIRTGKLRPDGKDKAAPWNWEKLPPLGEMNPEPKFGT